MLTYFQLESKDSRVPRYQNRSKLNSKTLTTKEQAESLKKKVYSILDKANSEFSAERRVSRRAATLVVKKSLKTTLGLQYSLREHRALKALSEFLNFSQSGKMVSKSVEEFTDLLPMGHPNSTKQHSMTASAFANARLLWVLADPRISEEAKPLVASVLVDAKDSPSYLYALTRLEYDTDSALPLQALIAAYGGGNSRAARSARARLQRRDKYGRFAFQGGGLSINVRRSNGNINRLTGRTVADTPSSSIIETPDGKIYSINEDSEGQLPGEYVKAILENTPDGVSPVPAIVKTGDPVVDEKDLVTLEMPPGFKKDESYKGVGTKYTDDAYDVIKFDKPSTQTRDRIGAAVKYATANDLPEIDQKKKGEDGKIWNEDKPIFEISRRGDKSFAFTQSWADTQESIEVDEPRLDASEGRTPELSRDEKLEVIQARLDAGDNLTDILPDIFGSSKEKETPEAPVSKAPTADGFDWKVPTGGYLLATDNEYDPEGRTDQEAKDYTDDPEVLGNKFSKEQLVQALEEALTSPDLIDSQETTDIIDQIRSDDEADGISTDELDENYEPSPEEIAEQEEILKKVKNRKVNNLATGYGSLSFIDGEELVPAESIYFALKTQGEDADKIVARIYDNGNENNENTNALNSSRGSVVETTVPDIADIIDSPNQDDVNPSVDAWDPESYEVDALRKDLSTGFDESGAYNSERNGFIFESDSDSGDVTINVIEGRDRSEIATIKEDGSLEWNTKNDRREAQDLQNDHGQDLWDTFVEYSNDESINLPAAMRNMSEEQLAKYEKDKEHFDFLKENDFYGDYNKVGLHDISSDSFDDWTDVGDMPEYPFASNNPVYIAQVLDTDSLKQSFQDAMYNKKDGTSPITYTDDNGEDVEFDIPAEAWRDALQLQNVDTDEILFELFVANDVNANLSVDAGSSRDSGSADHGWFTENVKLQAMEKERRLEKEKKLKDQADVISAANSMGQEVSTYSGLGEDIIGVNTGSLGSLNGIVQKPIPHAVADVNKPEIRTYMWIVSALTTRLRSGNEGVPPGPSIDRDPQVSDAWFYGVAVERVQAGDYIKVSDPKDMSNFSYVSFVESIPDSENDTLGKVVLKLVDTKDGTTSTVLLNPGAKIQDVRRPNTPQQPYKVRPISEDVKYPSSDGKTPINVGDKVSESNTGVVGTVYKKLESTDAPSKQDSSSLNLALVKLDGGDIVMSKSRGLSIYDEETDLEEDPSIKDVAKLYETSSVNGDKNHDVYLFFGNNAFAKGSKMQTDDENVILTMPGYSNPVSYPYGDIKSIAITPKRGASSSDSMNQEAPSDEISYRRSDQKVDMLRVGELLPAYFPTRGGEEALLKRRDKDPDYEMPAVDRITGIKYIKYSNTMQKASITVKNIETGKERTFEVNRSAKIYDVRTPIRTPQTPESQPQSGDLLESNPNSEDSGKKKDFTTEEKKDWKDNKVEGIVSDVVDSIIASLDKGEIPWQKGWSGGSFFPKNVSTNNEYRGINIFILMLAQEKAGYKTNKWVGKKQAEKIGGKLKPDQSGTEIMVPKIIKVKVTQKDGTEKEEPRVIGFNFSEVYNIDQFDGLNVPEEAPREPVSVLDAENRILELYKDKPEIRFVEMSSSESPNWSPSADVITLPKREQFDSSEQLLETLIHELAHSTGHPSRLNRAELLSNYSTHRASRGEEELIADMTAAMVASHLGVDINLENTAAYVQSWLKSLQNDRSFILKAATSASKAMDYMLGNTPNRGTNKPESNSETPAPNTPDDDFKQAPPSGSNSPSMGRALPDMGAEFYEMAPLSEEEFTVPNAILEDNYEYVGEKFAPTTEQRNVITAIMTGDDVVVRALAGTGKTSTLTLAARRLLEEQPKKKIVYIAFNKTVQMEGESKMPKNVESRTADSISFRNVSDDIRQKFSNQDDNTANMKLSGEDIAEELEIKSTSVKIKGDVVKLSFQEIPTYIKQAVNNFAISADDVLGAKHFSEELDEVPLSFVEYANAYWDDITSPSGVFKINNAHITKIWALSNPDLGAVGSGLKTPANVIFFDEAQDINPVLAKVVANQTIQKVYVGDGNQAIYAFRGAEDQLDKTTATWDLPLTQSFRFGPEIAGMANRFLTQLDSKYRVEGSGPKGELVEDGMEDPDVVITRTNSGGFRAMVELLDDGKVVGVTKGTKNDLESLVNSASWLIGDQTKLKKPKMHPDLAEFKNWSEVEKAVEKGEGRKIKSLYDLVEQNGIKFIKDTLNRVKVVTPESEKKDQDQDQVEDGAKGSIGNEIDYEVRGTEIRLFGNTYNNKDVIKSQKFRWDGKQWFKVVEDDLDRQKVINDLRRAIGGFAPDAGEEDLEIDVIVTTAHKSKGLQWNNVRIFDDFWGPRMNKKTGEVEMPVDEELRLAYVAVTRAQKKLDSGSLNWILDYTKDADELPKKPNLGEQGKTGKEIASSFPPDADFKQALPSGPDSPSNTPSIRESTKFYENTWMNGDKDYRPVIFMKDGTSVSGIRISAGDDSLILEIGTSTKPREISYDDISEITISPLPVSVESSEEGKKDLEVAPPPPSYKPTPIDIKTSAEFYEDTWMNGREGYKVIVFMKDGTQRDARRFSTNQDGVSLERGTSARPVEVSYDDIKDITILPEANLGNYGKTGEEIAKEKEGEAK